MEILIGFLILSHINSDCVGLGRAGAGDKKAENDIIVY